MPKTLGAGPQFIAVNPKPKIGHRALGGCGRVSLTLVEERERWS